MNRINSPHLPRAMALLVAFRDAGAPAPGAAKAGAAFEEARQRSPGGWTVSRATLAGQLQARLEGRSLPHQQGTSYCGCAAFLYCLLEDRPDWYVAYATALWRDEQFTFQSASAQVNVAVAETSRSSMPSVQTGQSAALAMNELDWMTMSCLSAATGARGDATGRVSPSDQFRAITYPFMVRRWFASVGAPARLDSVGLGAALATTDDLLALLSLWETCWLIMEIDAGMLIGGSGLFRRHWVVVDPETRPTLTRSDRPGAITVAQFRPQWQQELASSRDQQCYSVYSAGAVLKSAQYRIDGRE